MRAGQKVFKQGLPEALSLNSSWFLFCGRCCVGGPWPVGTWSGRDVRARYSVIVCNIERGRNPEEITALSESTLSWPCDIGPAVGWCLNAKHDRLLRVRLFPQKPSRKFRVWPQFTCIWMLAIGTVTAVMIVAIFARRFPPNLPTLCTVLPNDHRSRLVVLNCCFVIKLPCK